MFFPICFLFQIGHLLRRKAIARLCLNEKGNLSEHALRVYHALACFGKSERDIHLCQKYLPSNPNKDHVHWAE